DFPYDLYSTGLLRWDTCVAQGGDIESRVAIHVHEMNQSLRILFQVISLLKEIPGSEALKVDLNSLNADGEGFAVVESPRGETHAYVRMTENAGIYTLRLLPASYANIHGLECIVHGMKMKNLPAFVHSFNPCWACSDL
nr:hypothetical protein [Candidatus Sigynarchaeota archaeon]